MRPGPGPPTFGRRHSHAPAREAALFVQMVEFTCSDRETLEDLAEEWTRGATGEGTVQRVALGPRSRTLDRWAGRLAMPTRARRAYREISTRAFPLDGPVWCRKTSHAP
jgi:hypothetical protein